MGLPEPPSTEPYCPCYTLGDAKAFRECYRNDLIHSLAGTCGPYCVAIHEQAFDEFGRATTEIAISFLNNSKLHDHHAVAAIIVGYGRDKTVWLRGGNYDRMYGCYCDTVRHALQQCSVRCPCLVRK